MLNLIRLTHPWKKAPAQSIQPTEELPIPPLESLEFTPPREFIPPSKPEYDGTNRPVKINLVRAVFDEAQNVIREIDNELAEMEKRRAELVLTRQAHHELLTIATKYVKHNNLEKVS